MTCPYRQPSKGEPFHCRPLGVDVFVRLREDLRPYCSTGDWLHCPAYVWAGGASRVSDFPRTRASEEPVEGEGGGPCLEAGRSA